MPGYKEGGLDIVLIEHFQDAFDANRSSEVSARNINELLVFSWKIVRQEQATTRGVLAFVRAQPSSNSIDVDAIADKNSLLSHDKDDLIPCGR